MKLINRLGIAFAMLLLACLSTAQAQLANTVLSANFSGASGAPVDTSIWASGSGITLDGSGNADILSGQVLESNAGHVYSPLDSGAAGNVFVTYSFTTLPTSNHYFGLMTGLGAPWLLVNFPGGGFQVNNGSTNITKSGTNPSGSNYNLSIYWSSANNEVEFIQGTNFSGTVLATYTPSDLALPTSALNLDVVQYGGSVSPILLNSVIVQEGAVVPEPSTMALLGFSGLCGLLWLRRARR